jgi:predicted nucleic acid-binding protein
LPKQALPACRRTRFPNSPFNINQGAFLTLANPLAEHAFRIVVQDLEGFGNHLNDTHRLALRQIVETYSAMARGALKGRFAIDLPTGCGKTQSLIAWCQAVHELQTGHSVVVAASKVEELCDIKRKLIAKDVPEDSIGLIHSKEYDETLADKWRRTLDPNVLRQGCTEYASLPPTQDNGTRPFLLVTHSRIQTRPTNADLLNTYRGQARNLVIWDESLLRARGHSISKHDLHAALAWLQEWWIADNGCRERVVSYLTDAVQRLDAELEAQTQDGRPASVIELSSLPEFDLEGYYRGPGKQAVARPLAELLKFRHRPWRVVPVNQGGGAIVGYDVAVPRSLKNVIVLDASFPIRELEHLDPTIQPAPCFHGAVKRYDRVVINHIRHGCGRSAMEDSFEEDNAEDRLVSRELCDVIQEIDPAQGVIVFTFKPSHGTRPLDIRQVLERDLKQAGVDVDAVLPTVDGKTGKPRFRWLTWGQETAVNDHADCANVIFAGVLHRSEPDLAAAIVGQQDNLLTEVPASLMGKVRRSECAHALYQAMSRGSCRKTIDGQAKPMNVWLMSYDKELRTLLNKVMPGVVWRPWTPRHISMTETKAEEVARRVLDYLRQLSVETTRMSTRMLKKAVGVAEVRKRTFTRAIQLVSGEGTGWVLNGRSIERAV